MQAIPNRLDHSGWVAGTINWFGNHPDMPRYLVFGLIVGAFFVGEGVNNGSATKQAVTSVQTQYQGKLNYHIQNEKVIAKTVEKTVDACNRNLGAALMNSAAPQDLKNCPQVPPVVKAIAAQPATK